MLAALIPADATWALFAMILTGVAISIALEHRFDWARKLSGPVIGLLLAMALGSLGVAPTKAPVYDIVSDYLVPAAIPLLLLRANMLRIVRETGSMLAAFHISVAGTCVGTVVATLWLRDAFEQPAEVGGIMAASYTGGSVNFAAVRNTFEIPETVTNPLIVADNFVMAGMFVLLLVLAASPRLQALFRRAGTDERWQSSCR